MDAQVKHSPIIRAIDVGYGNVKFTTAGAAQEAGRPAIFPALAPRAVDNELAGDYLQRRNTRRVLVGSTEYEVGPDAGHAQAGGESGRYLQDGYSLSPQYAALVFGALLEMQARAIDVLVLGLPVNTWSSYKERVAARFTGAHRVTKDLSVVVQRVIVVPQPLGGFYDYSVGSGRFREMKDGTNLIIDPGFHTLDWLLTSGTTPIDARSGAVAGAGMAEALRDVAQQVANDLGCSAGDVGSIDRIDAALRAGRRPKVFGRESPRSADDYLAIARTRAQDAVLKMLSKLGGLGDIDNVMLVGGGSHVFSHVIAQHLPRHNVQVVRDGVFANVRGFQLVGEIWSRNNLRPGN